MKNSNKCCRPAEEFDFDEFLTKIKASGKGDSDALKELLCAIEEKGTGIPGFLEDIRLTCYMEPTGCLERFDYWGGYGVEDEEFVCLMYEIIDKMGFVRSDWKADCRIEELLDFISSPEGLFCIVEYFESIYKDGMYESYDASKDEVKFHQVMELTKQYLSPMQYDIFRFHILFGSRLGYYYWSDKDGKYAKYTQMELELLRMARVNLRSECKKEILDTLGII